jgi:hypothetical protein
VTFPHAGPDESPRRDYRVVFIPDWLSSDRIWFRIEHMTIQRMDHVGIVVDDLAAATEFFVELGLVLQGEGPVEGRWVDRVVGLEGVRAGIAMMQTPDGNGRLELTKFHSPSHPGRQPPRRRTLGVSATSRSPSRT